MFDLLLIPGNPEVSKCCFFFEYLSFSDLECESAIFRLQLSWENKGLEDVQESAGLGNLELQVGS